MARSFNGTSDYITTPITGIIMFGNVISPPNYTSVAVSCWVLLGSGAGSFPVIASLNSATEFFLGVNVGSFSGLNMYMQALQTKNVSTFTTGVWHHVLGMYISNGALTGTITLYDNGVQVDAGNTGSCGTNTPAGTLLIANNYGGNSFWKGSIADFAIWTAANGVAPLSTAEIVALSQGARPYTVRPGNLINYYPLDGLASPEPDLSGFARNGTLTGTALASGAPTMMFTPRTPQFIPPPAGGGSAIKFRKTLSQIGGRVGTRQPIGWGI